MIRFVCFTALSTNMFYKKAPSKVQKGRNEVQKAFQKRKTLGKWISKISVSSSFVE